MKLTFWGAAREVTGSKHLLEVNGKKILLDCGMFQGSRKSSAEKNKNLGFDATTIDCVLLSHAHIDHSGDLPLLVKNGFTGRIISTPATQDVCSYMLQDSAFIQEKEVKFMREHNLGEPVEPLYTIDDAQKALELFTPVSYHMKTEVYPGIHLTFLEAGHILGSAMIFLEIDDQEDGKHKTLTFTGDLGRKGMPLLRDPDYVENTDYLIMETTYGNRFHKFIKEIEDKLSELINVTIARGGKIIIPAFALERTQEIVYYLNRLTEAKRIPEIPIYVDSPLAVNVTEVFKRHPECFNKEISDEFLKNDKNPFGFGKLKYTASVEDSKALNTKEGSMIIISASGMCEFGRILHHLRNNIENPNNSILIVGYQAENTLGRKLVDGEKQVKIFGEVKKVKAQVTVLDAFSGHADRSDLIDFVTHINGLKKTFLVHGEESQGLDFAKIMSEIKPGTEVFTPALGEGFVI